MCMYQIHHYFEVDIYFCRHGCDDEAFASIDVHLHQHTYSASKHSTWVHPLELLIENLVQSIENLVLLCSGHEAILESPWIQG